MEFLNKNQKIILILIVAIMCFTIIYYIANKSMKNNYEEFQDIIETTEEQEDITKEATKTIVIYIVGEVEKEGIVELKEGERIADAIDKARRSNYKCRSF